eukprot:TRINITY_DN77990_c0_g1_i1.p1 TRINITY_DN77990_c0_g1~~TRINITY_DN77990_c0_g1_i1.p1  ORF type:complete len:302 (-),score=47.11 TRINITY_DN77990_c0_g1_i1:14-880(-)
MGASGSSEEVPAEPEGRQGPTPVTLQIYDVSGNAAIKNVNQIFRVMGTGAFHAAVEVYGQEWSFGYTPDGSGVFSCPPRGCTAHSYREPVPMAETDMSEREVQALLVQLADEWPGKDYDLLRKNCCHFSDEFCRRLGVGSVPAWVTNLAGAGATLNRGFSTLTSHAQNAAIIAAAKAGQIDEQYKGIRSTVQARAHDLLTKAGELHSKLGITHTAKEAASRATQTASSAAAAAAQQAHGVLASGKQARGANASDGYQFGDFTRGLASQAKTIFSGSASVSSRSRPGAS